MRTTSPKVLRRKACVDGVCHYPLRFCLDVLTWAKKAHRFHKIAVRRLRVRGSPLGDDERVALRRYVVQMVGRSYEKKPLSMVRAFLGVRNMDITWVGWPGMAVPAEEQEAVRAELRKTEHMPFECVPVFLDETTAELFYNGFCNNVLWPLLHYIPLSMLEGQAQVAEEQWAGYKAAKMVVETSP